MLDMKKQKKTDSANPIELPKISYRYCTINDQIPLIRSWLMMELIWIQLLFLSSACCFPGPHHIFQVFYMDQSNSKSQRPKSHKSTIFINSSTHETRIFHKMDTRSKPIKRAASPRGSSLRDWKIEVCSWLVCCRVRLHKQTLTSFRDNGMYTTHTYTFAARLELFTHFSLCIKYLGICHVTNVCQVIQSDISWRSLGHRKGHLTILKR